MPWNVVQTSGVREWFTELLKTDEPSFLNIMTAVALLAEKGPELGRPLVDHIKGSKIHNLKELRPGSSGRTEIRILFCFDPLRQAVLLVAGDKSRNWSGWYRKAIPRAEKLYEEYLKER